MRPYVLAVLATLPLLGADALPPSGPTERKIEEVDVLKLKLAAANIEMLNKDYKVEEYRTKVQGFMDEQLSVAQRLCKSVGVPDMLMSSQCKFDLGGKDKEARVWWEKGPAKVAESPKEAPKK